MRWEPDRMGGVELWGAVPQAGAQQQRIGGPQELQVPTLPSLFPAAPPAPGPGAQSTSCPLPAPGHTLGRYRGMSHRGVKQGGRQTAQPRPPSAFPAAGGTRQGSEWRGGGGGLESLCTPITSRAPQGSSPPKPESELGGAPEGDRSCNSLLSWARRSQWGTRARIPWPSPVTPSAQEVQAGAERSVRGAREQAAPHVAGKPGKAAAEAESAAPGRAASVSAPASPQGPDAGRSPPEPRGTGALSVLACSAPSYAQQGPEPSQQGAEHCGPSDPGLAAPSLTHCTPLPASGQPPLAPPPAHRARATGAARPGWGSTSGAGVEHPAGDFSVGSRLGRGGPRAGRSAHSLKKTPWEGVETQFARARCPGEVVSAPS